MKNTQIHLASLLGAGFLMLGLPTVTMAQTATSGHKVTNLAQTHPTSAKAVTGVIESSSGTPLKVRLADGTLKTYPVSRQAFDSMSLEKGTAIILDTDTDLVLSEQGKPIYTFNGRIVGIKNNQLTVMLTSGQVRTIPIQPQFAAQLKKLQQEPGVPDQMPITGIVHQQSPLSDIDHKPSTVTTAPTPQMAKRISQASNASATYNDLIAACQGRETEVGNLKALQDISNDVVEFDRIEVVDINEVLKGHNPQPFQQRHANHTKVERLMLNDALKNTNVIIPNTNQTMKLEQALLRLKVKPEAVTGVKVPDMAYGKVFVFYDSTAQ